MGQTLLDKIWHTHVVESQEGEALLFIDRHLGHDGSAKALHMLAERGLSIRHPAQTLLVLDHVLPSTNQAHPPTDEDARSMLDIVREQARLNGVKNFFDVLDPRNGISHVVGPEQGFALPGATVVCGDSHTATHGAFGALAFGIGATEAAHVFATQTLRQKKPASMAVRFYGNLDMGVYAKDLILALIGAIGTHGGTGHVIEYMGETLETMSMESRMTLCNMTIEAGARAGMIAPDQTTFDFLKGKPFVPKGTAWESALNYWHTLHSDTDAHFHRSVELNAAGLPPQVTWGTNPAMVTGVDGALPRPNDAPDADTAEAWARAQDYMGLTAGTPITSIRVDRVFIGSCTNSRLEDLRIGAALAKGKRVADDVTAWVVPGSRLVKQQAETEGLHQIFQEAGFQWREPGCSMCVGMNGDTLQPGERCASTTNRNFEGRQGRGGRTHLVSPATAVLAALNGHFVDSREHPPVML